MINDPLKAIGAPIVPAYGTHVVAPKQIYRSDNLDGSIVWVGILGEGPWNRLVRVFLGGGGLQPTKIFDADTNFTLAGHQVIFQSGDRNQVPDALFKPQFGLSFRAAIVIKIPPGSSIISADAQSGVDPQPFDIRVVAETLKIVQYDNTGAALNGGTRVYSTQPNDCTLDFLLSKRYGMGIDPSEIDWQAWSDFGAFAATQINDAFIRTESFQLPPTYNRPNPENETLLTVGFSFKVTTDMVLTHLGRQFNTGSKGVHNIGIWVFSTGQLLGQVAVNPETNIAPVETRINLTAGTLYVVGVTEGGSNLAEAGDAWSDLRTVTSPVGSVDITEGFRPEGQGTRAATAWFGSGFTMPTQWGNPSNQQTTKMAYADILMNFDVDDGTRTIPRFDMNVAFFQNTDAITALSLMEQHCFFKVVESNGKFTPVYAKPRAAQDNNGVWFPATTQGTPDTSKPPLFHITRHMTMPGTFRFDTIPNEDLPKEFVGVFRDLDDDLLRERTVKLQRPGGGKPLELNFGSMRISQAVRVLSAFTRSAFDLKKRAWFKTTLQALGTIKFDLVQISHRDPGWERQLFEVHQLNLNSDGTLGFVCKEFNPLVYSDTDISPIDSILQTNVINFALPPPQVPASSIVLAAVVRVAPSGLNALFIQSTFTLIFPATMARILVDSGNGFEDTGIDARGSFLYGPVERKKQYTFKFVAKNPLGMSADEATAPTVSITPSAGPGSIGGDVTIGDLLVSLGDLAKFIKQNRGALRNVAQRLRSLLPGLGNPWTWVLFAVAGLLISRIKTLSNNIVGELEENQTLGSGAILIDLPATTFDVGMTVWARANYLKRKTGVLAQQVTGSVLLQCLIFDVDTSNFIWGDTVSTAANLPGSAQTNEIRIIKDVDEIHKFNGTTWAKIGNVIARAEKETMARRIALFLFSQETSTLTVPAGAVEIHARIEAGANGLTTPTNRTFAVSNLDLRFNPADTPLTIPTNDQTVDEFDVADTVTWQTVDLGTGGSVTVASSVVKVDNGGSGDFSGMADSGVGWVRSLPDDGSEPTGVSFDHDFTIKVKLGAPPVGTDPVFLILRASNAADSECIGVRYKAGALTLFSRVLQGNAISEDSIGLSVTLQTGDWIKIDFTGARINWFHSVDGTTWTAFTGASQNMIIDFPLAKLWLAAGAASGSVVTEFDSVDLSVNAPIEAPAQTEAVTSVDVDSNNARWSRIRSNLVTNPVFQFWSTGGVLPNGWTRQPTGDFIQNTSKVRTGSSSLQFARLSSDSGTSQPGPIQVYNAGSDIGGQIANASAYFTRYLLAGIAANVILEALDSNGAVLATFNGGTVNSTTWQKSTTGNVTLPAGTFSLRLTTFIAENNFRTVFMDDASLIVNSIEKIVNGGFETWASVPVLLDFVVPSGVTLVQSTDSASFGFSAEITGLDSSAGYSLAFIRDFKQDISGINFSALLRVKIAVGNSVTFQLQFQDANDVALATISSQPISSTTFSTKTITGQVAPSGSQKIALLVIGDNSTTFRADFLSLVPGDVALDESVDTGISLRALDLIIDSVQKAISVAQAAADAAKSAADEIINLNGSSTPQSVAIDAQTLASDTQASVGKVASDIKTVTGTVQSVG